MRSASCSEQDSRSAYFPAWLSRLQSPLGASHLSVSCSYNGMASVYGDRRPSMQGPAPPCHLTFNAELLCMGSAFVQSAGRSRRYLAGLSGSRLEAPAARRKRA